MKRVLQTKTRLADSLKDLMQKTPFLKITIQNVTDHCGLNRQTFYYHFRDMFDLLGWIYHNEILPKEAPGQNWRSLLLTAVAYAQKNKVFLRNINRSLHREAIERFIYPDFAEWVTILFDSACGDSSVNQEDRAFLLSFLTSAFVSFCLRWIGDGMPYDGASLLDRAQLIFDMVQQASNPECPAEKVCGDPAYQLLWAVRSNRRNFL